MSRLLLLFFWWCVVLRDLHSFPTRRSSDLSPATLRNVMADLEEAGYLAQPHASAGRVPTDRKSTRLNSSHVKNSYAVCCLQKKKQGPYRPSSLAAACPYVLLAVYPLWP